MRNQLRLIRDRLLTPSRRLDKLEQQIEHLGQRVAETEAQLSNLAKLTTSMASASPPGWVAALRKLPTPAVSVIIPTFNRAVFLEDAISSVLRQTFSSWELVVVNDGGTDDTDRVIAPYLEDPRISCVRRPNAGAGTARNMGIAATTAPLIAYLDDDNVWYPGFLETAVAVLTTEPLVDFVYGALVSELHGLSGIKILWREFARSELEAGNYIDTNVIVHRRSLIDRFGGWDTRRQFDPVGDWDIALRYTKDKPARRLDVLAAYYREADAQRISRVVPADFAVEAIQRRLSEERIGRVSS